MSRYFEYRPGDGYEAWLQYRRTDQGTKFEQYAPYCHIAAVIQDEVMRTAVNELSQGLEAITGHSVAVTETLGESSGILLGIFGASQAIDEAIHADAARSVKTEGYAIQIDDGAEQIAIGAADSAGLLYGVFHLLRIMATGGDVKSLNRVENPVNSLRMINQWDNMDGSVERGYAGSSIFYQDNRVAKEHQRIQDYARLLASCGINAIAINNVNVHRVESRLLTDFLPDVTKLAAIFRQYAIKLYLSINYASTMELGGLSTADPLNPSVREWWREAAAKVYEAIPDFGGFLVKADSEHRPGPFTYGRDHADGANMLAEAVKPYGGVVIWRCFVYNCKQDWRDRSTDRARAAYDHFRPLDGRFLDNVILQIKNGPIDFQVREPVSPLIGAMPHTNQMIEFQIAQEYTGQQRHVCYLVPQWKEVLDFDTYLQEEGTPVKRIVDGTVHGNPCNGFAAVSNIGSDANWTGHLLAQANLFGYGRLAWNPELSAEEIAKEWIRLTFGSREPLFQTIYDILMNSWEIYESYTTPLGVGFMVNPDHHYGPNVEGYEYSPWGTYHYADNHGIGVDRTTATGTGYTAQYANANKQRYESLATCPDELLLFFHHVPYTHKLHSGKTVIQHIYDTHFEGAERAGQLLAVWERMREQLDEQAYRQVADRLEEQAEHAKEWRDRINTYFYRRSGIPDELGRTIY
ncbi:alpha-glucuronidase [Paenibacillus sp. Marseille-P2973]|uniref:alpha-glucuronidase family glycosyl hydrolase n=1 Tax=Paenibacillus sp. Marseille-P2973 TaxID=1871032 RepID=UPI001B3794A9|nr:alpha-glucuronidase family glycosyl hydrolase [Paenibacillus sp. Marseille-P2973]MBQ4897694.1 alpha-glucuronidase [Paenibacillus sp. Marseille-P2973]